MISRLRTPGTMSALVVAGVGRVVSNTRQHHANNRHRTSDDAHLIADLRWPQTRLCASHLSPTSVDKNDTYGGPRPSPRIGRQRQCRECSPTGAQAACRSSELPVTQICGAYGTSNVCTGQQPTGTTACPLRKRLCASHTDPTGVAQSDISDGPTFSRPNRHRRQGRERDQSSRPRDSPRDRSGAPEARRESQNPHVSAVQRLTRGPTRPENGRLDEGGFQSPQPDQRGPKRHLQWPNSPAVRHAICARLTTGHPSASASASDPNHVDRLPVGREPSAGDITARSTSPPPHP